MSQTTVSFISDVGDEFQPMAPPEGLPECSESNNTQPPEQEYPKSFASSIVIAMNQK